MNDLILDVETTIKNKGNPFTKGNKCVCVGTKFVDSVPLVWYDPSNAASRQGVQDEIIHSSIVVGFNIKFDLHWLRNLGVDISMLKVWDCQLAEFILGNQRFPYPSLNDAAIKYGFEPKIDIVKLEYWDKGIDTHEVPSELLSSYLKQDLLLTEQVYKKQLELFQTTEKDKYALFRLHCHDLLVLEEMEYSGIKFNTEKALAKADEIDKELNEIAEQLKEVSGGAPINYNSNDHISALLYGGTVIEDLRIPVGVYKTGAKVGQTRFKIVEKLYELPRLIEPLKGTETAKSKKGGGTPSWEVNETTLRKLKLNKEAKQVVSLLNKYAELSKLSGTYLRGYSKLIQEMNWPQDMLHGVLNQCVAVTGRLSSSKPNLQNADPTTKIFMESRY